MSTPTRPIAVDRTEDVRAYIGAVRAWLADLPAEDVDDLILGMEADLSERAAEGDVRLGELLGEPEVYAAELRAAAGLPPRAAPEVTASSAWSGAVVESTRTVGDRLLGRFPWLRDLRPLWWIGRGLAFGWLCVAVSRVGLLSWVVGLLLVPLSFWWGRRSRDGRVRDRAALLTTTANWLAVLLAVWALLVAMTSFAQRSTEGYIPAPGLSVDGGQVQNLYVYDAQGNRVDGARILDQDGKRLYVDPFAVAWTVPDAPTRPDGSTDVDGDVFPLVVGDRDPWADPHTGWTPPLTLPPLPVQPSAEATSGPTPTSTPSPSASP